MRDVMWYRTSAMTIRIISCFRLMQTLWNSRYKAKLVVKARHNSGGKIGKPREPALVGRICTISAISLLDICYTVILISVATPTDQQTVGRNTYGPQIDYGNPGTMFSSDKGFVGF